MASFSIVTDSSANLPEEFIEKHGIEILSLRFMSDGEEFVSYRKGETTDLAEFYRLMREGKVFTTSLPYLDAAEVTFRSLLDAGRDVFYIGFSSGISGTYSACSALLDELAGQYPERQVMHIDTLAAALGEGMMVMYAAEMAAAGRTMQECYDWQLANRPHAAHWFTVDDLMYLYRGGRVSRTSATAANVLSIKPVLQVDDEGKLIPKMKVRSRKRSIKALFEKMQETYDPSYGPQHVTISHGDCLEDANALVELIRSEPKFNIADITVNILDPVIGAHSGPGTLALFYLGTSRD